MTEQDIRILKLLSRGRTHKEASEELKAEGFKPNSISHIEKLMSKLRKQYKAKTFFQLAVKLTRRKII